MAEVGQVKERNADELEDGIAGGGFAVVELDDAGDETPVWLWQAAVGHGAVDDAVFAFAGLDEDAAGKQKWIGVGIDHSAAGAANALRAADLKEAAGMHVEAHVSVIGVDEHVIGAAL